MIKLTKEKGKISLDKVLAPIQLSDFEAQFWGKQHLLLSGRTKDIYDEILTLKDIDFILNNLNHRHIQVIKNDMSITSNNFESSDDLELILESFNQGASVILNRLEKSWPPIKELCLSVFDSVKICKSVFANVYLAPSKSQAFDKHVDYQDTFIMQLEGSKLWRIFDPQYMFPLDQTQCNKANSFLAESKLQNEVILKKGDLMYIPRGTPHEVLTLNEESLHITLSIIPFTYADVITSVFSHVSENNSDFRSSLPWNFFDKNMDTNQISDFFLRSFDKELPNAINSLKKQGSGKSLSNYSGYFYDHKLINEVGPDSIVAINPHSNHHVSFDPDSVRIESKYNDFQVDLKNMDFRFILGKSKFSVKEIPGSDSIESKVGFIKDLLRAGVFLIQPSET